MSDQEDFAGCGATDDRGQYRIANLTPGRYYAITMPRLWYEHIPDGNPRGAQLEFSLPAVYPGVQDDASAVPVEVTAGAVLTGIDITLPRTRLFTVRGVVANATGLELGPIKVSLRREGERRQLLYFGNEVTAKSGGEFEIHGVPPGAYELIAKSDASGITCSGVARVVIENEDLDDAGFTIGRNAELAGRYRVETLEQPNGAEPQAKLDPGAIYLELFQSDSGAEARAQLSDGAFRAALLTGRYYLFLSISTPGTTSRARCPAAWTRSWKA